MIVMHSMHAVSEREAFDSQGAGPRAQLVQLPVL